MKLPKNLIEVESVGESKNKEDEQKQVKAVASELLRTERSEIKLREPEEHEGCKLKDFEIKTLETRDSVKPEEGWQKCKLQSEELPHRNGKPQLERPDQVPKAEYQTKLEGMVVELQKQEQELQKHDKPATVEEFEKSETAGFEDMEEQKHRLHVVNEDEARQSNGHDLKTRDHQEEETKKPTTEAFKKSLEAEDWIKPEKEREQEIMQPEEDQKMPTRISHEKARIIKYKEVGEAERKDGMQKHEKHIVPVYEKPKDAKVPQKEETKPQIHELQGDEDHRLISFETEASKTVKSVQTTEESQGCRQGQEKIKQKVEKTTVEARQENLEGLEPTKKEEKEVKDERKQPEKQDAQEYEPHQILEAGQQIQSKIIKEKIQHEKEVEHEKLTNAPLYENPKVAGSIENEAFKPDIYVAMENENDQRKSSSKEASPKITESMKSKEVSADLQQKQGNEKQKEKSSVGHPRDMLEVEEVADSEEEKEKQVQEQLENPKGKDLFEHGKQTTRTRQEKDDNMLSKEQKELDGENKKPQVDELNRVFKAAEQIQLELEQQVLEHAKSTKKETEKEPRQMLEARSTMYLDSEKPWNTGVKEPQKELEAPKFIKWQVEKQLQEKREYCDHEESFVELKGKNNKTMEFWEPEDKHGEELEWRSPNVEGAHIEGSLKPTGPALYALKPEEPKKENCKKNTTDGPDHVEAKDAEQGLQQSEEQNVENKKPTLGGKYLNLKPTELSENIKPHQDLIPSREDQDVDESCAPDITQEPIVGADLIKIAKETKQELDQPKKFKVKEQNPNETQPYEKTNTMGLPNLEELDHELSQIPAEEMECGSQAVRKSYTKESPQLKEPSHSPQREEEQPKGYDSSLKSHKQHVEFQHPEQDKVENPSFERELKLKRVLKETERPNDRHLQLEEEASLPLQVNVVKEQETRVEPKQEEQHQRENTRELQKPIAETSHQTSKKAELSEEESKLKLHTEAAKKYEAHEPWHTKEQGKKGEKPRQMTSYQEETEREIHLLAQEKDGNENDGLTQLDNFFVEQQKSDEEVERNSLGKELAETKKAKEELLRQAEHGSTSRGMKSIGLKKHETEAAIEQDLIESTESNKNQESAVESPYQTRKVKDFIIVDELEGQPKLRDQQQANEKIKETKMFCTLSTHQEIPLSGEENAHELGNRRESEKQNFEQQQESAEKIERPAIEIVLLESEKLKKAPLQPAKQEESLFKKPTTLEKESKSLLEHIESRKRHETTIESPYESPDMIDFIAPEELHREILMESEPKGIPKQEQYQNKGSREFENLAAGTLVEAPKIEEFRSSEEQEHKFQARKGQKDESKSHNAYQSKENEERQNERTQLSADEHFKHDNMKSPEKIPKLIQTEKNVQKPLDIEMKNFKDIEMKESVEPKQGIFRVEEVVEPQGLSSLKETDTESLSKSSHNHEAKYMKTEEPSQAPQLIPREENEKQLQQDKMEATECKTLKPHKTKETEEQKGEQLNSLQNNQEETTLLEFDVGKKRTPIEKMLETAGHLESKEPYKNLDESLQVEAELQLKNTKEVEAQERICLEKESETLNRPSTEPPELASETNVLEKLVREKDLYQHEEEVEKTTELSKSWKQLKENKKTIELDRPGLQLLKEAAEKQPKLQIAEQKPKQTDFDEAPEKKPPNRAADNTETLKQEQLYQTDKQEFEEAIESQKEAQEDHTEEALQKTLDAPRPRKIREVEHQVYIPKEIEEEKQEHNSLPSFDHDLRNPEDIQLREVFSNEDVKPFGEKKNKCTRTKKPSRQHHFQCQCTGCRPEFPLPPSTLFAGSTFIFSIMVLVFHFINRKEPN